MSTDGRNLTGHRGDPFGGCGPNLLHIGNPLELPFDGNGNQFLHILGGHPFIGGGDKDIGNGDIGKVFPRQGNITVYPRNEDKHHEGQDRDLSLERGLIEDHWTLNLHPFLNVSLAGDDQTVARLQPIGDLHPVPFDDPDGDGPGVGDTVFFHKEKTFPPLVQDGEQGRRKRIGNHAPQKGHPGDHTGPDVMFRIVDQNPYPKGLGGRIRLKGHKIHLSLHLKTGKGIDGDHDVLPLSSNTAHPVPAHSREF